MFSLNNHAGSVWYCLTSVYSWQVFTLFCCKLLQHIFVSCWYVWFLHVAEEFGHSILRTMFFIKHVMHNIGVRENTFFSRTQRDPSYKLLVFISVLWFGAQVHMSHTKCGCVCWFWFRQ
jgi:hypothetical protein